MSALGIRPDARITPRSFGKSCPNQADYNLSDDDALPLVKSRRFPAK